MLKPAYDLSFYEFDDEQDVEAYDVLLCDVVHGKPAMKPLYIGVGWYWYYHALRYAAETLQLPTTHGWDSRFINGYPYITTIRTTEEEVKAREPHFKENIRPFIEDFDSVWASYKAELLQTYQEAKAGRGLNAWEDIRNLSDIDMLSFFLDFAFDMTRKEAEIHMIMMTSAYYINGLFLQMWQELFEVEPSIDPAFNRLMAGFESQDIKVVRQMWQLARKAVDLGLEGAFQAQNNKGVLSELEKSEAGAGWLEAYRAFLLENGWRCERMHAYHTPAWIEKPELAIGQIKMLLSQDSLPFDTERDRLIQEREQAEQESLSKVPLEQRLV
jgi:pyruvate,water dikinase